MSFSSSVCPLRVSRVLRTIPGVDFEAAFADRLSIEWDGVAVNVIGREDLIRAKRAAGRERDLRDLRALERVGKR
jgi:hypothetical protein